MKQKDATMTNRKKGWRPWRRLVIVACVEERPVCAHVFVQSVAREFVT